MCVFLLFGSQCLNNILKNVHYYHLTACTGRCPNKHGNNMTTSMSSLFQAGLFRKYDFLVTAVKHLTLKTTSLGISTEILDFKRDFRKFVHIQVK